MNNYYSKNDCTKDLVVVRKFETLKYLHIAIIIICSIWLLFSNFKVNQFERILNLKIPFIILSILGYTCIKKDFGKKSGFIFSALTMIVALLVSYICRENLNIWPITFIVIALIYSHKIYRSGISSINWIIFSIFSFLTGISNKTCLIISIFINILLFMYFLVKNITQRNYVVKYIKYSKNLIKSIISITLQIVGYILFYIIVF